MAALPLPAADAERVRQVADDVLARPEFADARPGILDRVIDAVVEFFGRLLETVTGSSQAALLGTVIILVVVAVLLWAAVRFARTTRRASRVDDPVVSLQGRTAAEWALLADEHESAGRLRESLRCRYRGLVAALAAEDLVDEIPGRTAGEYLNAVRESIPDAGVAFTAATLAFEAAWYGREPLTAADIESFTGAERDVKRAAGLDMALATRR